MSNSYVFTIVGAYNYDRSIFDGLELPDSPFTSDYPELFRDFPQLDRDVLVTNLLLECSQLSLLYTDTDFLKEEIAYWSKMHALDWQQTYETMLYHYNPIWNKDGSVTETEAGTSKAGRTVRGTDGNTRTLNTTDTSTLSGQDKVEDSGEEDATTTNSVNAFNSGSPTEHDRSVIDSDWSSDKTVKYGKVNTDRGTGTIKDEGSKTETVSDTGSTDRRSERLERGNIGITTTQAMIREQRAIIMNMYQYIIGAFKERFCIMIW